MDSKLVAIAGGSGFIGGAIARRLAGLAGVRVRILTRNPQRVPGWIGSLAVEVIRADVTDHDSLRPALRGATALIDAIQFDGYPVEDPGRGLTFDRIDYGGVLALLEAARNERVRHFIYISGAAAAETDSHPAFRAKARAERAIRQSDIPFTIFRPSLVFGPDDRVINVLATALRFAPILPVPGSGRQKVQPVLVDDLAACVAIALTSPGNALGETFEVGGPQEMSIDELVRLIMELTRRRRPILHIPEWIMRIAGALGEMLPWPLFSRDVAAFLTADNVCNIEPLVKALGIRLTPAREAMAYLVAHR